MMDGLPGWVAPALVPLEAGAPDPSRAAPGFWSKSQLSGAG